MQVNTHPNTRPLLANFGGWIKICGGNNRLKLVAECVSMVSPPYVRDGVVVVRLGLNPSSGLQVGIMMVNYWSPWIWIDTWNGWNVVWVASYLEPLGPLPATVITTSYNHIKLSFVCGTTQMLRWSSVMPAFLE
jgi:hypothetical protein